MNVSCNDRDRIFEDGSPMEWEALEAHSATCAECQEEFRAWKLLSVAAQDLRDYTVNEQSWPRIERALNETALGTAPRVKRAGWFSFLRGPSPVWQTVLAASLALALTISGGWIYVHREVSGGENDKSLLKSGALTEVESAERAFGRAIDKLAAETKPELENPATPLQANYHEKLIVLDSAITELREQAGLNPSNAQLRYQLLAMYQEKQKTLEEVLEAKQR
jgi:hypothetical protein